jgi:DNA-binding protein HU-beta
MNQSDLITRVSDQTGMARGETGKVIAAVIDGITEALRKGEDVRLAGFGSFSVVERREREGRNPRTGETVRIAASKAARFSPAKTIKEALKG